MNFSPETLTVFGSLYRGRPPGALMLPPLNFKYLKIKHVFIQSFTNPYHVLPGGYAMAHVTSSLGCHFSA